MKKTCRFARLILPMLLIACFSGNVNAAPYGPKGREINWVQPGGEKLKLRVFGDEFYGRTETEDGYTVVYNPKDGAYHYAEVGEKGLALKPTGVKAHLAPRDGTLRHVDLPKDGILRISQQNRQRFTAERQKLWNQRVQAKRLLQNARLNGLSLQGPEAAAAKINAAPVVGDKVGLTILAQFPNDPKTGGADPIDFPVTRAKMVNFCNKVGYTDDGNSGSVRDFYFDQSNGLVTYTQTVTQIVTLPHPRNYYNYANYPTNSILQDTAVAGQSLIADAVAVLKTQGFDFSSLTVDGTGNAIATNLFFAGPDSGVWAQGLWPHQYHLETGLNVGTTGNPIFLYNYEVTNIENAAPVIGTFCHENGHLLLGYPDLYDVIGEGVGEHCLMGSGNYLNDGKTPSPINAYLKDIVGWANITDLSITDYVNKNIPTTGNIAYRIYNSAALTESFIVENRGKGDKWAEFSDDKGIAIWHIDETVDGNIAPPDHYMVSLEQADGRFDLERGLNRGDATDLYDNTSNSLFTDTTAPDATWWDGSNSSIRVKVLGAPAANVNVQFGLLPVDTIVLATPNGGEVLYRNSTYKITWEANIVGNVKIDLFKNGIFDQVIAKDVPNNGTYSWNVPLNFPPSEFYTVRISSISNSKPVNDSSDAVFAVTDSTFPAGNVMPYGWKKPSTANAGWEVTKSVIYEGTHSLMSKPIGDGKIAAVAYTSNFKSGKVSFYMKVSSEVGYDYASFAIDGVKQTIPTATSKKGLTGLRAWVFATYPVTAGKHTLTWSYEKDDSYATGKDAAWIDGVLLPETTQEIVVENSNGDKLSSGADTVTFPSVREGSSSAPETFTIRNTGKADLYGLKVVAKGTDPDSFAIGALGKTVLKSGESTTFDVTFKPSKNGRKSAEIRILSNDANESPFVIAVNGRALGIPHITVSQPSDTKLKDNKSVVGFGYETVGQTGKTRTFTVKNVGTALLTGLKVTKSGSAKGDFSVRAIGSTSLAPGESTTFKVTFTPGAKDLRTALLHVSHNFKADGSFEVNLEGNGVPKNLTKSALAGTGTTPSDLVEAVLGAKTANVDSVASTKVIDGSKYLALTIAKPAAAGLIPTVEVSSNLVDWFSGSKHTTIVTDNESFRTVRDNTPVTPGQKRYIRLKP